MVRVVDGIRAFHNAFRNDLRRIDAAALGVARGREGEMAEFERYRFFDEILSWHASGEERGVFPALDAVAPFLTESYVLDHRGLDAAASALERAVRENDAIQTARATAAFRFHLDCHLNKEDLRLYRHFDQMVPLPEQQKALGVLAGAIPPDRFPEVVLWLFPLIGHDDRENVARIFQANLPPDAFVGAQALIRKAIGPDWAELVRRIPNLEAG